MYVSIYKNMSFTILSLLNYRLHCYIINRCRRLNNNNCVTNYADLKLYYYEKLYLFTNVL